MFLSDIAVDIEVRKLCWWSLAGSDHSEAHSLVEEAGGQASEIRPGRLLRGSFWNSFLKWACEMPFLSLINSISMAIWMVVVMAIMSQLFCSLVRQCRAVRLGGRCLVGEHLGEASRWAGAFCKAGAPSCMRTIGLGGIMIIARNSALGSEKAMAPYSGSLAWKIPWMEGPGRLQSMGLW